MNITNIENIFLIALFVVPGFISIYVRDVAAGIRKLDHFEKVVLCIFFSFINLGTIVAVWRLIDKSLSFSNMSNMDVLKTSLFNPFFLLVLFCLSLFIGFLFAIFEKLLYSKFRSFFRLATLEAGESVFITIFDQVGAKCVEAKMKDGYKVRGAVKHVSDEKGKRQLYVVNVEEYQGEDQMEKDEYLEGVYLDLEEAEYVRVLRGVKKSK